MSKQPTNGSASVDIITTRVIQLIRNIPPHVYSTPFGHPFHRHLATQSMSIWPGSQCLVTQAIHYALVAPMGVNLV